MDVLILRDPRESVRKCSLTSLRGAPGVRFVDYHPEQRLSAGPRLLLHPEGSLLGEEDAGRDLLLIDCAWRRLPRVLSTVDGQLESRRLPPLTTAYPRRSRIFQDPPAGLASIEALYAASVLLGQPRPEWLEGYHWREEFLAANPRLQRGR